MHGFTGTQADITLDPARARMVEARRGEGVGALGDIDVQRSMQDRSGVGRRLCRIREACHPEPAHLALQSTTDPGWRLPGNGHVRDEAPERIVLVYRGPPIRVGLLGKPELRAAAEAAGRLLRRVGARLAANAPPVRAA